MIAIPIGPHPMTNAVSPRVMSDLLTACRPTAMGSVSAACRSSPLGTDSNTGTDVTRVPASVPRCLGARPGVEYLGAELVAHEHVGPEVDRYTRSGGQTLQLGARREHVVPVHQVRTAA
jgi:hypothetical protein